MPHLRRIIRVAVLSVMAAVVIASVAYAHDFWLVPDAFQVAEGAMELGLGRGDEGLHVADALLLLAVAVAQPRQGFARLQARGNRPLGGQLQRVGGDVHPALLGLAHVAAVNVDADFVPVVFQVRVRGGGQTDLHGLHRLVLLQLVEFRAVGGDDRREIEGDLGRVLRLDLPFLRDRQEVV